MTTDTKLKELIINKLTTSQYDSIEEKDPNQLYIVTDAPSFDDTITNCLTKIPQDVILELNDGTLTLKAGSKVYVPNGFEADGTTPKFDVVVVESDFTISSFNTSGTTMLFFNFINMGISLQAGTGDMLQYIYSGTTAPTVFFATKYAYWYDTASNIVKQTSDGGSTWNVGRTLPFCIVSYSSSGVTSIDQIFNGFGYIGSTVFALPGVKGLIPNGRNEDGTLRNLEFTISNVSLNSDMHLWGGQVTLNIMLYKSTDIGLQDVKRFTTNKRTSASQYVYSYDEEDNYWYYSTDNGLNWAILYFVTVGSLTEIASNKSVSNFKPKTTFQVVDYNDFANTPHIVDTYKNGTSWYRVWSDGWCEQGGISPSGADQATVTITLLKAFSNTSYTVSSVQRDGPSGNYTNGLRIVNYSTNSFQINYRTGGTATAYWVAYGYTN